MESTIPQTFLEEFRICRNSGGIWIKAVHHTLPFSTTGKNVFLWQFGELFT
jgi:hypothetical protein